MRTCRLVALNCDMLLVFVSTHFLVPTSQIEEKTKVLESKGKNPIRSFMFLNFGRFWILVTKLRITWSCFVVLFTGLTLIL